MNKRQPAAQRYVCIHGHFYQPPRENAWLEAIEVQDSASPYHDWNERIDAECYAPNASARILDAAGQITSIVNNYERISFNFGPTLLSWLEAHRQETYEAILTADSKSRARFGGHGSAIAQVYNHPILPLCNARDKRTQVLWGLADFQRRFGREAKGMWLPETAVDVDSLEVLAAEGVRFTVLAPRQLQAVRDRQASTFVDVDGQPINPRHSYALNLPSGRQIALFFYDGPLSQAVAFERLLSHGDRFAAKLVSAFKPEDPAAQLVHMATDGETYGHHHRFGEMALSFALQTIDDGHDAELTNYGQFLELHPPTHEAQIVEPSSWSCAHGVGRWSEDCGCNSGAGEDWTQKWRRPLRDALDGLRDALAPIFEHAGQEVLLHPWLARDAYIDVILERQESVRERFFEEHAQPAVTTAERSKALCLLEMQRNAMLMYTSCGWFFDEISGIETIQILQYAARALELASRVTDVSAIEQRFLERLEDAPSNLPEHRNGRNLYERTVRPTSADLRKVAANFAAGLLFDDGAGRMATPAYRIEDSDHQSGSKAGAHWVIGRVCIASEITLERQEFDFAFGYLGDPKLRGGTRPFAGDASFAAMRDASLRAFQDFKSDTPANVDHVLAVHFPDGQCSLHDLFREEQRRIVRRILESTVADVETVYQRLYDEHGSVMELLAELDGDQPRALRIAGELVAGKRVRAELQRPTIDADALESALQDARKRGVALDEATTAYAASVGAERLLHHVVADPEDPKEVQQATRAIQQILTLPFHVDLRGAQDTFYRMLRRREGSFGAARSSIRDLGAVLGVAVDQVDPHRPAGRPPA